MSEERAQISMSNTKKEMLKAYKALLDGVQKKSLENPKEEQKQIELLQQKIKEMETQLREAGLKVSTSEETVRDIALRAIDSSAMTSRALSRESRPTASREGADEA